MIRHIELINFMCHPHTVIDPAEGLTVLAGPNNCGKSAVVVALRTLCENIRGDFMVKHGESDCRVRVETDDGHELEWRRQSGTVSYKVNGREIHRLQGSTPDDLHVLLRLPKVSSPKEGDSYDVHFARQKSPIFLLDQPGGDAARFFASSSDAALLMKMQEKHKEKVREKKGEKAILTTETERLKNFLERLKPAEEIDSSLKSVEKEYERLVALGKRIESLQLDVETLSDQTDKVEHISVRVDILKTLTDPPKLVNTGPLESLIADLADVNVTVSQEKGKKQVLSCLTEPPELHNVGPLEKLCEDLQAQLRELDRTEKELECYKALADPPMLLDTQPLEERLAQLRGAQGNVAHCEARLRAFDAQGEVPTLEDTKALSGLVDEIQKASEAVRGHRLTLKTVKEKLEFVEKQIRQWANDHPICPTCGAKVDPERLVAAGSIHNHAEE